MQGPLSPLQILLCKLNVATELRQFRQVTDRRLALIGRLSADHAYLLTSPI
jgi:hypothetical protein